MKRRLQGLQSLQMDIPEEQDEFDAAIRAAVPSIEKVTLDSTRLISKQEIIGRGGNGIVFLAEFEGRTVAVKESRLENIEYVKKLSRMATAYSILSGIKYILFPLKLMYRKGSPGEGAPFFLLEIYPLCKVYQTPTSLQSLLFFLLNISTALCDMHKRGVAHLDFKQDNILLLEDQDGRYLPCLSDFGETRIFFPPPDEKPVISTTISLIINSAFIRSLFRQEKQAELFNTDQLNTEGLYYLIIFNTPYHLFPLIDQLLFGIFLIEFEKSPHLDQPFRIGRNIYSSSQHIRVSECGKNLVSMAMLHLYNYWAVNAKYSSLAHSTLVFNQTVLQRYGFAESIDPRTNLEILKKDFVIGLTSFPYR